MSTMSHLEQSASPHRCETEVWHRCHGFPPHWVFSSTESNTALDGKVSEVGGSRYSKLAPPIGSPPPCSRVKVSFRSCSPLPSPHPSFPPVLSGHSSCLPDSYAITTAQDLRATSVSRLVTSVCGHLQHGPRVVNNAKDAVTPTLRRQSE